MFASLSTFLKGKPASCDQQECKSFTKFLTPQLRKELENLKDPNGYTFERLISSGKANPKSSIGVYAGSIDTYTTFSKFLNQIIEDYHFKGKKKVEDNKFETNWNINNLNFKKFDENYVKSTRIRFARNFKGYPLGAAQNNFQRKEIEDKAIKAFESFDGDLKGKYFKFPDLKNTPSSKDNKKSQAQDLIDRHYLYEDARNDHNLVAAGLADDFPLNRGIFINVDDPAKEPNFLIWVNEEDEFRFISMQKGGDLEAVYRRLYNAQEKIQRVLEFEKHPNLGFITSCPSNLGTGVRASVHVKLPNLASTDELLSFKDKYHVDLRSSAGETGQLKGSEVIDVSNARRLGFTEYELINDMYKGVNAMIEREKQLENEKKK